MNVRQKSIFAAVLLFLFQCSEAPLIDSTGNTRLNNPSSIVAIPGTDLAIVANSNVNLSEPAGSLIAINLSTREILEDTSFEIPNFSGDMAIDAANNRILIPDNDESLLVFEYMIPGENGEAISFSTFEVADPVVIEGNTIENGVQTDAGPSAALIVPNTSLGEIVLVANDIGTLSIIRNSNFRFVDLDDDQEFFGLRLLSSSNFENPNQFPGRGSNRMSTDSNGLVFISSPLNNQIYVFDPESQVLEAMIDLNSLSAPVVGIREIEIDSNGIAYIAHSGLDSIVVMDFSTVIKNGVPFEVLSPALLAIIPVGDGPEDIELKATETELFVSHQNEDSIYLVDTNLRQVINRVYLDQGSGPVRLLLDETRSSLYSLDFFSNSISILDATTGQFQETVE